MKSKYAIVCGSRCGSTHLCDLLKSTRRAGNPEEYFNKDLNFDHLNNGKGFIDSIVNGTKTENDVFGVKMVGKEQLKAYNESSLEVTHCVLLTRRDSVDQAISRYKAWKTDIWHFENGMTEMPPVEYSFGDIKWCLEEIIEENKFYQKLLDGTNFLEISYEDDLLENPDQTIVCILNYLGISIEELPDLKTSQIIFRNEESAKWKTKFLEELDEEQSDLKLSNCAEREDSTETEDAISKLSQVYNWIEKNNADGFNDSQSYYQNLDRCREAIEYAIEQNK